VHIFTDSESCINTIIAYLNKSMHYPITHAAGRTYLLSILSALRCRQRRGTATFISHVPSRTGARDSASIGNEAADRKAGAASTSSIADAQNIYVLDPKFELPYQIQELHSTLNRDGTFSHTFTSLQGNLRSELNTCFAQRLLSQWGQRGSRGKIARLYPIAVQSIITQQWKQPSSTTIDFVLTLLTLTTTKGKLEATGEYSTSICDSCGTGTPMTTTHELVQCPAMADLLNAAATNIWNILDTYPEPEPNTYSASYFLADRLDTQYTSAAGALKEKCGAGSITWHMLKHLLHLLYTYRAVQQSENDINARPSQTSPPKRHKPAILAQPTDSDYTREDIKQVQRWWTIHDNNPPPHGGPIRRGPHTRHRGYDHEEEKEAFYWQSYFNNANDS
jgi:hypothetical protein